jgi:hypothetical protein
MPLSKPAKGHKYYMTTTVDSTTVEAVDKFRGLIPRSRVVESAILQYIERETGENKKHAATTKEHKM